MEGPSRASAAAEEARGLTTQSIDRPSVSLDAASRPAAIPTTDHTVSLATATLLSVVFLITIASGKTLITKAIFENLDFPYPVFFSLLSCVTTAIGCVILFLLMPSVFKFTTVDKRHYKAFGMVTLLTALDMAFTNTALSLLSVALQQCFRAALPVVVTLLEKLMQGKQHNLLVHLLLIPMTLGPILVTLGSDGEDDKGVNVFGLVCQVLAVVTAATKAVTTHQLIKSVKKEMNQVCFLFWLDMAMMPILITWTCVNKELWQAFTWDGWDQAFGVSFLLGTACMGGVRAYSTNLVRAEYKRHSTGLRYVSMSEPVKPATHRAVLFCRC